MIPVEHRNSSPGERARSWVELVELAVRINYLISAIKDFCLEKVHMERIKLFALMKDISIQFLIVES